MKPCTCLAAMIGGFFGQEADLQHVESDDGDAEKQNAVE